MDLHVLYNRSLPWYFFQELKERQVVHDCLDMREAPFLSITLTLQS
mgnify:CR=1 FL=1